MADSDVQTQLRQLNEELAAVRVERDRLRAQVFRRDVADALTEEFAKQITLPAARDLANILAPQCQGNSVLTIRCDDPTVTGMGTEAIAESALEGRASYLLETARPGGRRPAAETGPRWDPKRVTEPVYGSAWGLAFLHLSTPVIRF